MDLATIGGFVLGMVLIVIVMQISGSIMMYWDFVSILIVIGGAFGSSMMRWPLKTVMSSVSVFMNALFVKVDDPQKLIDEIIELATTARKDSLLALEKVPINNAFLEKAVKLAVDGTDPEIINSMLNIEIDAMKGRHKMGKGFFDDMGEATPAFGMIGTVIGLIVIMANLTNPSKIGPGLAVALVTTLYGSLVANMVFIPLAKKLSYRSKEEVTNFEIVKEGIAATLKGENPRTIREKLESIL